MPCFHQQKTIKESYICILEPYSTVEKRCFKEIIIATKDTYTSIKSSVPKKIVRKMGIRSDQEGILQRYILEGSNWNEHLRNTKQAIIDFVKEKEPKSLALLGSGWLLDIPMQFLADRMQEVILYDIRHPRAARDKYAKLPNVLFLEADLSGGLIEATFRLCRHKPKLTPQEVIIELLNTPVNLPIETDYLASVNLLNQLDILIIDYLKKFYDFPADIMNQLRKTIQSNHLRMLKPGQACLITDVEEIHINDQGIPVEKVPLIFCELPAGHNLKSWIWKFDTHKNYHPEHFTDMYVTSMNL
jgi:hypothetical protein